eukprot:2352520-Pleurochrysis_carterae.AAC.2
MERGRENAAKRRREPGVNRIGASNGAAQKRREMSQPLCLLQQAQIVTPTRRPALQFVQTCKRRAHFVDVRNL